MPADQFYLVEFNIGRIKAPLDAPQMKEFVDFLNPVNRFAEESPGFIWRLAAPDGMASSYLPPAYEDEMVNVNLTVWKDIDALKNFVYQTVHAYFLRNRKRWFDQMVENHVVLWWVHPGHTPTVDEAKEKLRYLDENGPTASAFTLRALYDPFGNSLKQEPDSSQNIVGRPFLHK